MLNKYVVRQPIKDSGNALFGYEIMFQSENDGLYNISNDSAVADSITGFLTQNNNKIFDGKMTFMTFTPNLLFKNTPLIFNKKDLVIQIEDSVIVHPLAMPLIQKFRKAGFSFAVNDFQFAPRYFGLMEYIDYIKVNFRNGTESSLANIVNMGKGFNKKCVAYGVDTKEIYEMAQRIGVDYFQGAYVAEVMTTRANKSEYLQSNFFQLVVEITKDEPDVVKIEEIVSRDASLTYALLKMVNSAYFALRNRTSSIRQALVTLGLGQLKQWIYLLSFGQNSDPSSSEEILKVSFLRANFSSELMDYIDDFPISRSEAYLMGMFSTLGYMIDATLEEIFEEIPIADEVKNALIHHEGRCGILYDLVLSYEKADWKSITKCAEQLGIPTDAIAQVYFDCVEQVNDIWESLTTSILDEDAEISEMAETNIVPTDDFGSEESQKKKRVVGSKSKMVEKSVENDKAAKAAKASAKKTTKTKKTDEE